MTLVSFQSRVRFYHNMTDSNPQTENKVKPKTVSVAEDTDTD